MPSPRVWPNQGDLPDLPTASLWIWHAWSRSYAGQMSRCQKTDSFSSTIRIVLLCSHSSSSKQTACQLSYHGKESVQYAPEKASHTVVMRGGYLSIHKAVRAESTSASPTPPPNNGVFRNIFYGARHFVCWNMTAGIFLIDSLPFGKPSIICVWSAGANSPQLAEQCIFW